MSRLILDGLLVERLIAARFRGGRSDLIAHWDSTGSGINASTVYRWTRGGLPKSGDDLLRLASLLDVDPFCLLTFDRGSVQKAIDTALSWAQRNKWERFKFFQTFFGRQSEWPPKELSKIHFERSWNEATFHHEPSSRANYYAVVQITPDRGSISTFPQTFHFAYRQQEQYAGRWLAYGFVVVHGEHVRLQHINGQGSSYRASHLLAARVQTFFGPSPAEFKVASLHPFSLRVDAPEQLVGSSVCFPA